MSACETIFTRIRTHHVKWRESSWCVPVEQMNSLFELATSKEEARGRATAMAIGNLAVIGKNQIQMARQVHCPPS